MGFHHCTNRGKDLRAERERAYVKFSGGADSLAKALGQVNNVMSNPTEGRYKDHRCRTIKFSLFVRFSTC